MGLHPLHSSLHVMTRLALIVYFRSGTLEIKDHERSKTKDHRDTATRSHHPQLLESVSLLFDQILLITKGDQLPTETFALLAQLEI
ncbi:hypothetical protein PRIPAC_70794 [Pristionchus pacificus]|uniref:Uncharacterized protein n=1 Tax=Pristionchus pacificus TaxID=54126 RepID=A0A2A6BRL8_PRIPA|nr:hypothetical protein PRIPAC_70794 [Pristionchus pacificus]|eukprot:PDM68550.1 hypothetical protein PRIPAC_44052 [Pristionchus pacificus]